MNYKLSKFVMVQFRHFATSRLHQKSHYDSLGISKNATQADVKSAYYNLSKVYHPDRNQGGNPEQRDQHSKRFRAISEAYEVLGNVQTRRMYDKGFLIQGSEAAEHRPQKDPLHNFYKSRERRTKPPDSRQPVYDFDMWSKMHYGETIQKNQEAKRRREQYYEMKEKDMESMIVEKMGILILLTIIVITWFKEMEQYDVNEPKQATGDD